VNKLQDPIENRPVFELDFEKGEVIEFIYLSHAGRTSHRGNFLRVEFGIIEIDPHDFPSMKHFAKTRITKLRRVYGRGT